MKAISAIMTRGLGIGSYVIAADNSGARIVKITGVKKGKTRKRRVQFCGVGSWVKVSVREGKPDMKGQLFDAVVIRQKKPYRRLTGERICFTDNAVVLLKDEKGNPKGTQIKGPVPREVQERWKEVAKIAPAIV
ncbi:MAG: uL14 family ribosomal protein [Candidatus Pacearchaeota archaeon]|nr:uL14 family ribosomal protein [Candidatus Pacearchaeota archaeon]